MLNTSFAPTVRTAHGKGPRTKRARLRLHPEWEIDKTKKQRHPDMRPDYTPEELWGPTLHAR